ncbi:asparagine synthetase B [Paenibacillus sp. FSL A5-0031]|uniref:lasso peptide isopeptide bond-forming cyclase n=1 Tax=Paenibacillus sp. FSL A5-0031 TaxID=1920420 RepID=UPI00096FB327|nr:lasso peptide isopeptide bond-forming cyclase [Paenibacillus sp. FSL A5-0031]OME83941.1 asparagine synthetase B [Paenibacillus sp. FSL A5-0031]
MSAIAGVFHTGKQSLAWQQGDALMEALSQFPCNTAQAWHADNIFLGCHNQWITPESINERNPFLDDERGLVITADAIIDNRIELFNRLEVEQQLRRNMTDSELILLAYDKWGDRTPIYLAGDYAFLIWDCRRQKLFGARDFSGGRTLYYHRNNERVAFCTTIEPLLTLLGKERLLNEQWLAEFLAISGMVDVADASKTAYRNIEQIPPSHTITITAGRVTLARYHQLRSDEVVRFKSNDEYVEAFQDVFQQAVTSRLRTHRNVGAQLSGGLDSGSIVGFASKTLRPQNKSLHTFSYVPTSDFVDYTHKSMITNERPLIESTVEHVGGIEEHYLDFRGRDSYSEIDGFLDINEMPYKFFENSFWIKGMFEKAEEQGVGVLLNGGRGNLSISWGAAIPYYATLLKKMRWIKLLREMRQYSLNIGSGRAHVFSNVSRAAFPFIEHLRSVGESYHYPMIISPEFAKRTDVFNRLGKYGIDESGWFAAKNVYDERKSHFDEVYHWNAGNTVSTKLSLRYSLWKRDPTNDVRVIRFCLSLPEDQYVQNGMDRALIRRATDTLLPDKVRLNQRTRGVQGADWVHRMRPKWQEFKEELRQMSQDRAFMQFVDGKVVRSALAGFEEGAQSKLAIDPNYRLLMRSLIVYRFLKKLN